MSTITMIPERQAGNVYTFLLYRALEQAGIRYVQIPFSLRYLLRQRPRDRFHYLHFHWPEIFFVIRPREVHKLFGLKGYLRLHAFWLLAKLRGYRLVWTVHEVDVHDLERHTRWHAGSRRLLWKLADVIFTHSAPVREAALQRWGARPHVHLLPIGSYDGAYPDTLSREEARARLGVPEEAFAFVFFGNVRPYKGVDVLLQAWHRLQAAYPKAHLIVAGKPLSETYAAHVRARCAGLERVHLTLGYVPDEDVQVYLRAADCFVAPYRYIETCSAIYLALAFDLPVIIPAQGNVVDFVPYDVGVFVRDPGETEAAMRRFLEMPAAEMAALRQRARRASEAFAWDGLRERYAAAFRAFERDAAGGPTAAVADRASPA